MARILFTVCGVGLGHAPRSTELIKGLQKNHEIMIASYGDALTYLKKHFRKSERLEWFKLVFQGGELKKRATVFSNLPLLPSIASKNFIKLMKTITNFKPDLIISDFDVNSLYAGQIFNIPVIVISSLHVMEEFNLKLSSKDKVLFYLTEKPVLRAFTGAFAFIHPFFFDAGFRKPNHYFFGPIVRQSLAKKLQAKPKQKEKNKYLVYFSTDQLAKLLPILKKIDAEFIVYGVEQKGSDGNISFRHFSEAGFINDLIECKGVLCHGGTTTISEALVAGKPVYVCSSKKFFERYLNGVLLQERRWGIGEQQPSMQAISNFVSKNALFKEKIRQAKIRQSNDLVLARLEQLISEAKGRKKLFFPYSRLKSINFRHLKNYFSRILET